MSKILASYSRRTALAALALVLGSSATIAPAAAQDEWEAAVRAQIQVIGEIFSRQGFALSRGVHVGSLDAGAKTSVSLELDAGKTYHIIGVCDGDCTDLDLALRSPSGEAVATDVLPDDTPSVSVMWERGGTYALEVTMAACSQEPCRFGIGVFAK